MSIIYALIGLWVVSTQPLTDAKEKSFDKKTKPHIIMFLADDLGFNDVPWHNEEVIAPNIQKLAKEGVILEQSYVQPVCTPTRAAILSGVYPFASGRQAEEAGKSAGTAGLFENGTVLVKPENMDGIIWPLQPTGLTLGLSVIPEYLKPLGYETHAVGKWHLGFCKWEYTPTKRGFETFRGYYTGSEDYYTHERTYYSSEEDVGWPGDVYPNQKKRFNHSSEATDQATVSDDNSYTGYDFRDNMEVYRKATGDYSAYEFTSHAENIFLSGDPKVPKFIYMAFQSVHTPLEVPENYTKPYENIHDYYRRTYLGMVSAMDEAIGRIVTVMKKTGHYDNSVIVFTTDNGGPTITGANNWPLRGNKTTLWEGGTRGAAFVHSPLIPNPGRVTNNLIHATDWLATFVAIAGGTPPNGTDSINQWDALIGREDPPRNELVYNLVASESKISAGIRVGDYKLLVGNPGPGEWIPPPELSLNPPSSVDSQFNFVIEKFALKTATWDYGDHRNFIQKVKLRCRKVSCFRSILKMYRKTKTPQNRRLWSKMIDMIKKYITSFKEWRNAGKNRIKKSYNTANVRVKNGKKNRSRRNIMNETILDFDSLLLNHGDHLQLYYLKDDPEERVNLVTKKPRVTAKLLRRLMSYKCRYVPADKPKDDHRGSPEFWGGAWSPGWC